MNKIQELNDKVRKELPFGTDALYHATVLVDSLSLEDQRKLFRKFIDFNDFNEDNDPYGEHDFISVEYEEEVYYLKIDYYDLDLEHGSPDPADESKTKRVVTIMHCSEY